MYASPVEGAAPNGAPRKQCVGMVPRSGYLITFMVEDGREHSLNDSPQPPPTWRVRNGTSNPPMTFFTHIHIGKTKSYNATQVMSTLLCRINIVLTYSISVFSAKREQARRQAHLQSEATTSQITFAAVGTKQCPLVVNTAVPLLTRCLEAIWSSQLLFLLHCARHGQSALTGKRCLNRRAQKQSDSPTDPVTAACIQGQRKHSWHTFTVTHANKPLLQ